MFVPEPFWYAAERCGASPNSRDGEPRLVSRVVGVLSLTANTIVSPGAANAPDPGSAVTPATPLAGGE